MYALSVFEMVNLDDHYKSGRLAQQRRLILQSKPAALAFHRILYKNTVIFYLAIHALSGA
jgi:hypothetical protein